MYSIIIPTMWRSHRTFNMLKAMAECEKVGEIIIIDNDHDRMPLCIPEISKVMVFTNGQNNYVNPSWNLGVDLAEHKYIALVNDDITFSTEIFNLKPNDDEIIGVHHSCYDGKDTQLKTIKVGTREHGFGCLMMMQRKDYKRIPNELKVSFGDDYLFSKFTHKSAITGVSIGTEMSTTSRDAEFIAIAEEDSKQWHTLNNKSL
jgi:hypothetical protein